MTFKNKIIDTIYETDFDNSPKFIILPGSLYLKDLNLLTENNFYKLNTARNYLGTNYSFYRINNFFKNNWFYRHLIYNKQPEIILQFSDKCLIYKYKTDNIQNMLIGLKYQNNKLSLKIGSFDFILKQKSVLHLGNWETEKKINQKINKFELCLIETDFWYNYYNNKTNDFTAESENLKINSETLENTIKTCLEFSNKTFDYKNNVHCEFINPDYFNFNLNRLSYCLPTYEFARIYILSSINMYDNNILYTNLKILLNKIYVELNELNCAITHNTIGIDDYNNIFAHTQFNTGYSGYPGGIASDLIYIIKFLLSTKIKPDTGLKNKLEKMVVWLKITQHNDFTFPYTIPSVSTKEEKFYKCGTGKTKCISSTAAAGYVYLLWYTLTNDNDYLNLCLKTINTIIPEKPFYFFESFGFLRDAGENETDGISYYYFIKTVRKLIQLNPDKYSQYIDIIEKLSCYLLQWVYKDYDNKIDCYADPMTDSFSPRIGLWDTLLWSEMFHDIFLITEKQVFKKISLILFNKTLDFQNKLTGGIPESVGIKFDKTLVPININNGISLWLIKISRLFYKNKIHYPKHKNLPLTDLVISYSEIKSKFKIKKFLKHIFRKVPVTFKQNLKNIIRRFVNYKNLNPSSFSQQNNNIENKLQYNFILPEYEIVLDKNKTSLYKIDKILSSGYCEIIRVYSPIIKYNETITVNSVEKINNMIKSVNINNKYDIVFEYGFPTQYFIKNNKIYFDMTLKARWDIKGKLKQMFYIK